ncbi:hypothetical protein DFAR_2310026 [Desulfarculales bacterium]
MGSGKATALRWAAICVEFEMDTTKFPRAVRTKLIRKQALEIIQSRKKKLALIIGQAPSSGLRSWPPDSSGRWPYPAHSPASAPA